MASSEIPPSITYRAERVETWENSALDARLYSEDQPGPVEPSSAEPDPEPS